LKQQSFPKLLGLKQLYMFGNQIEGVKYQPFVDQLSEQFPSLQELSIHGNGIIELNKDSDYV
jgi:hypothetical protein